MDRFLWGDQRGGQLRPSRASRAQIQIWNERRSQVVAEMERQRLKRRQAEAERKTADLARVVEDLQSLLRMGLHPSPRINLQALRRRAAVSPLDLGALATPVSRPDWDRFAPRTPGLLARALGGQVLYKCRLASARDAFEREVSAWEGKETERQREVAKAREDHARRAAAAEERAAVFNRGLDDLIERLQRRDRSAVEDYLAGC